MVHPSSDHSAATPAPVAFGLSGPRPAPMAPASTWEWSALIPVALDGKPLQAPRLELAPRLQTSTAQHGPALVAIALLAFAAAVLSALLI